MRGTWVTMMEVFNGFVESSRNVGKGNPRVLGLGKGFPSN
jgi:hypothetical protein